MADKCYYCKKEYRRATKDDMDGLVWADELQDWVCPTCEKRRIAKVIIAQ